MMLSLWQLLDMAGKLGPALQVGEGLVWKPPAPTDTPDKAPQTSVQVAQKMDAEISRGGAAYVTQDTPANDSNNNNDSNTAKEDNPAGNDAEVMGLDRKDFESLEQESTPDVPVGELGPPPSDVLYASPAKGLGGGLPPLRGGVSGGGLGGKGGLPSLANLPPLPTEDPNDEEDSEIEEEIETETRRRPMPAM